MSDHSALNAELAAAIREGGTSFGLRRNIKRKVERFRKERRTLEWLDVDPDLVSNRPADHDTVISWIQTLRRHVDGVDGMVIVHRKQGKLTCSTCKLLGYLCMVFMNSSKQSQYGPLLRVLGSWAVASVIWVFSFSWLSQLLQQTNNVNALGDTFIVAIAAGVVSAALVALPTFVREATAQIPGDLPPFLPIWLDRRELMRERRLRNLRFTAVEVLKKHGLVPAPRPPVSSGRVALVVGLLAARLRVRAGEEA